MYKDPIITKLIERFNASGPVWLKNKYFYGDPLIVNASNLPAVFITKDETNIRPGDNVNDDQAMAFVINAVFDLKRDFNRSFDTITGTNQLYEAMEARDDNGDLRTDTLVWQVRNNQALGDNNWIDIDTATNINYGLGIEKRGPGVFTVEATIRIIVRHNQLIRES